MRNGFQTTFDVQLIVSNAVANIRNFQAIQINSYSDKEEALDHNNRRLKNRSKS
jgi:hypothetical protein